MCAGTTFLPGVNYLEKGDYLEHPTFKALVKKGLLKILEAPKAEPKKEMNTEVKDYKYANVASKALIQDIKEISKLQDLQEIVKLETRVSVVKAAEKRLEQLRSE